MKKRIFIIGSPLGDHRSPFYRGVMTDINNYYRFFLSSLGGAFQDHEIIYLENPSWELIAETLADHPADFSIVVFSGHGYYSIPKDRTVFQISPTERASLPMIIKHIKAPKKFVISDTCRTQIRDEYHYMPGIGDPADYQSFPSPLSSSEARRIFDSAIGNSRPGTQILYSCSPGENSTISSKGSTFSNSLFSTIRQWAFSYSSQNIMNAVQAFKSTERHLKSILKAQTPQLRVSLTQPNFPLAVKRREQDFNHAFLAF